MATNKLLEKLVGSWEGTCCTWFEPGELADESVVEGQIVPVLDGRFFRHIYVGTIQGKTRRGEELLAFNGVTRQFQSSWVDDFHMSDAIMFSRGIEHVSEESEAEANEFSFTLLGEYDVEENGPRWGWKTMFRLTGSDRLTITAYNIAPGGTDEKAMETKYQRIAE